jgi:hypothetical protein
MESVSAVINVLWSSNGEEASDALSNADSVIDKEAMSSAEVTSLSIITLQPSVANTCCCAYTFQ